MKNNTFILYHGGCYDGFGAAWAAYRNFGDRAVYLPCLHGNPLPEIPDGSVVYILDFSFPREALQALYERSESLRVLDHHATAEAQLAGLEYATFDLTKSGARLAWEYFFPHEPVPELLAYVEDRDLWAWKLPHSREVAAAMRLYPFTFKNWDWMEPRVGLLKEEGRVAVRVIGELVSRIADEAVMISLHTPLGLMPVPAVNAPLPITSEVCEELLRRNKDCLVVAAYCDRRDGMKQWGLRSRESYDCSAIAKIYGGGGHPQSSGFQHRSAQPGLEYSFTSKAGASV